MGFLWVPFIRFSNFSAHPRYLRIFIIKKMLKHFVKCFSESIKINICIFALCVKVVSLYLFAEYEDNFAVMY